MDVAVDMEVFWLPCPAGPNSMQVDYIHALVALSFVAILAMIGQIILRPPKRP
jgi:hypothetical protein